MSFSEAVVGRRAPASVRRDVVLPRRQQAFPSPVDWRDEVLYFLLVDRFSDGLEDTRPSIDRANVAAARLLPAGRAWQWDLWTQSGADRWQGGTIRGVTSKLAYLQRLGVTTLWLSPVFKQRGHLDSYHGYGVQDFLDVDPRFGDRADLVRLVAEAHDLGLRIILDVIFNHSGSNWIYAEGTPGGRFEPSYTRGQYDFGAWLGADGAAVDAIRGRDDGAWPVELQAANAYTRAGRGDLGAGELDDPLAEHKRTDFLTLRDFSLSAPGVLTDLARCYKYWIALTDCDGFRIDTLKHVSFEEARNFCGTVKEFAATIGKENFLLVGEIAGGDFAEGRYLDVLQQNLNAALDIGDLRLVLRGVARGLLEPNEYFKAFEPGKSPMGSHRSLGNQHVSILDDHDHVFGPKTRFSSDAPPAHADHQVAAGVALQLFTLGIPCVYYGTEQAFAGPESAEQQWLSGWGSSDVYLREAMFGPAHPRASGRRGLGSAAGLDTSLPGFGAFGTSGHHAFDETHPAYVRIAAMSALRRGIPVLRHGRQYSREISLFDGPFAPTRSGEIVAWSRILDDEEALCVLNANGSERRGGDVLVDAALNPPGAVMTVMLNTAQVATQPGFAGTHVAGSTLPVRRAPNGSAFVEIRDLGPSEILVLMNHPQREEGGVVG